MEDIQKNLKYFLIHIEKDNWNHFTYRKRWYVSGWIFSLSISFFGGLCLPKQIFGASSGPYFKIN